MKRFTPESVRILNQRGLSFADMAGGARLILPDSGLLILHQAEGLSRVLDTAVEVDTAMPITARGGFRWPPAALAVGEWMLVERRVGTVDEIAAALGLSHGRVAQILAKFDALQLTTRTGGRRGRSVQREPKRRQLLTAWGQATADIERPTIYAHTTERNVLRLAQTMTPGLDELGPWAITGWLAASILAPFVTQVPSLQICVPVETWRGIGSVRLASLGLTPVDEPARVAIWPAVAFTLSAAITSPPGNVPVCHPVRVYADLLRIGGRAQDAATHLREELLQ